MTSMLNLACKNNKYIFYKKIMFIKPQFVNKISLKVAPIE